MTPKELQELDEVVGRMTPGKWRCGGGRYLPISADVKGQSAQIGRAESFGQISDEEVEANGVGIVALRNSYSQLRDHIKALESKVKELEK